MRVGRIAKTVTYNIVVISGHGVWDRVRGNVVLSCCIAKAVFR